MRPHTDFLFNFLKITNIDVILWSYGAYYYVQSIVNGFFPQLCQCAFKIYGRTVCKKSNETCGIPKSSNFIRKLYSENIILIGVDDRVNEVMDDRYDFRILIDKYSSIDTKDTEIIRVIEKITQFVASL